MAQANDITVYQDGDRFIIGRKAWQTCYSRTYGIADAYSRPEVREIAADVAKMSLSEIEAAKRVYWTDSRNLGYEHRSMTLDTNGDYPFFTVAVRDMKPVE